MNNNHLKTLALGIWLLAGGGAKAWDFTMDSGQVLKDVELLRVSGEIVYVVHDGGVAELPLSQRVTAEFHIEPARQTKVIDPLKLDVEKWLIDIKNNGLDRRTGFQSPFDQQLSRPVKQPRVVDAEKYAAYKKAVGEKYVTLTVGGKTFNSVTITRVDPAYIYFSHDKGAGKLPIPEFGEEWMVRFSYDATEANELIEEEQAAKLAAADTLPGAPGAPGAVAASGGGVRIVSASYGAGNSWWDVRQILQSKIDSGQTLIRANSNTFGGDPCFGKVKTLVVRYYYRGQTVEREYREGDTFMSQGRVAEPHRPVAEEVEVYQQPEDNNRSSSPVIIRSKRPVITNPANYNR